MSEDEAAVENSTDIGRLSQQIQNLVGTLTDFQATVANTQVSLIALEDRIQSLEMHNTANVSDLRKISKRLSDIAEKPSAFETDDDLEDEDSKPAISKKRNSKEKRRSTLWDAIEGRYDDSTDEEEIPKPRSKAKTTVTTMSVEPTIVYPKELIKTLSVGGLLKLAENLAYMEVKYKGRHFVAADLLEEDVRRLICNRLTIQTTDFIRYTGVKILQCMVYLVRPKTQKEYMQAYERYAKIDLPDQVPKLLSTRSITSFYTLIYGPVLEVLNKFQKLYDIFQEDATDKLKRDMPREEWGQKEEPQLFSALFNAFGVLNQPLLSRVKLREVKKCKSLDELIALIRKVVNADKKASEEDASVCVNYGQDVKSIYRAAHRLATLGNVVRYSDGTSDEDDDEFYSLPSTPLGLSANPSLPNQAPDPYDSPMKLGGSSDAEEDEEDLQAFSPNTPKPSSGAQQQRKGCLSFYRNNGKCKNMDKRGNCQYSHDPADIVKLHDDMEALKRSNEFRTFMDGLRAKAKTPQRPGVTFGQKPGRQFASDLVRSSPGVNAAASPSFEKKLYHVDMHEPENDDHE